MSKPTNDPPEKSRFRKGKSGNPLGRPYGAVSLKKIAEKVAHRKMGALVNGKRTRISIIEYLLKQVIRLAASGNISAARLSSTLYSKLIPEPGTLGYLIVPETMGHDEWEAAEKQRMEELEKKKMAPNRSAR